MPVYEFRCDQCGAKFSSLVGMTADSAIECPQCSGTSATKLVSRVARYRTEDQRVEAISAQLDTLGEPESIGEARNIVREMGKAMDDDMSEEMEQLFDEDVDDLGE